MTVRQIGEPIYSQKCELAQPTPLSMIHSVPKERVRMAQLDLLCELGDLRDLVLNLLA